MNINDDTWIDDILGGYENHVQDSITGRGGTETMYTKAEAKAQIQQRLIEARIDELLFHANEPDRDSAFFCIVLPNKNLNNRIAELEAQLWRNYQTTKIRRQSNE